MRHEFVLTGGLGFCNAMRRVLSSDIKAWAPYEVHVRTNTSCQTDEYVAHRIGMIPFRKIGNGDHMDLKASGSGTVFADAFIGAGFEPTQSRVPVMQLGPDQSLDLTVRFDERSASQHARYAVCAAIGMRKIDDTSYAITFELNDDTRNARDVMSEALDALDVRVDKALKQLAHQEDPPKSMC